MIRFQRSANRLGLLAFLALGGCAGKPYARPEMALPQQFRNAPSAAAPRSRPRRVGFRISVMDVLPWTGAQPFRAVLILFRQAGSAWPAPAGMERTLVRNESGCKLTC